MTDTDDPSKGWRDHSTPANVLVVAAQDKEVGARLQALREARDWSREALAYHAGVSTKTVERIEKGQVEGRRGTIRAIAEALGVDEYAIIGEPVGPQGVPLSDQVGSIDEKFTALVQQIFERDDRHREQMYERLDRLAESIEEARHERVEQANEVRRLLQTQSELLDTIKGLLGMDGGTTLQDHLAQEVRDALRDSAD